MTQSNRLTFVFLPSFRWCHFRRCKKATDPIRLPTCVLGTAPQWYRTVRLTLAVQTDTISSRGSRDETVQVQRLASLCFIEFVQVDELVVVAFARKKVCRKKKKKSRIDWWTSSTSNSRVSSKENKKKVYGPMVLLKNNTNKAPGEGWKSYHSTIDSHAHVRVLLLLLAVDGRERENV